MDDHPDPERSRIYVQRIRLEMVRESTATESLEIKKPEDVWSLEFLQVELGKSDREKFICLHLTTKNALISWETVSMGSLSSTVVHPREVFKSAILTNSSSIILCHNHPSGDPNPSAEDIALTKRLAQVGDLLGITLLDHIIFGGTSFTSCKDKGYL